MQTVSITNAPSVLERIRDAQADAEIIVLRLLDGETDTLLTYANEIAYTLDDLARQLEREN